jgi:GNAT superfamily N-acetyltransferase
MKLRAATAEDVPTLLELVQALACYEREPDAVTASEADLLREGFGQDPAFRALLAEDGSRVLGFALYFFHFSTWLGRRSLYLEDLFVLPEARGRGVGRALFQRLARIAVEEGCGRYEWAVLDWNTEAIGFYERMGAKPLSEWTTMRLEGEALRRLASEGRE